MADHERASRGRAHADHAGHDHGDHDHDHAHNLREAGRKNLVISLVLIGGCMIAEIIGGLISGSLALLADAAHMFTDAAAIGLALFAVTFFGWWIADPILSVLIGLLILASSWSLMQNRNSASATSPCR